MKYQQFPVFSSIALIFTHFDGVGAFHMKRMQKNSLKRTLREVKSGR